MKDRENLSNTGIKLTGNEIEEVKVIKFLENTGILFKKTTKKIKNQGGFLASVHGAFLRIGVPLLESILTLFGKCVLLQLQLTTTVLLADAAILKKMHRLVFGNFKYRNGRYLENS